MKKFILIVLFIVPVITAYSQNLLLQEIESRQKLAEGPYEITKGDCIDLGLSVKWASCNLDASSYEEYGGLYSWGEIKTKKNHYKNKYEKKSISYLQKKGIIDVYGNLTKQYDAAYQIKGDSWHIPTWSEMNELITKCKWYKRSYNGVNGYLIQGPNGNTIFLPWTPTGHENRLTQPDRCQYLCSTMLVGNFLNSSYGLFDNSISQWFFMGDGYCIRPVQK